VVGLVTAEFVGFARELLRQRSAETLPLVVVGHPVGGIAPAEAEALVTDAVIAGVVRALTGREAGTPATGEATP